MGLFLIEVKEGLMSWFVDIGMGWVGINGGGYSRGRIICVD